MFTDWRIKVSKQADRFLDVQNIEDGFIGKYVGLALRKFNREDVNIKIKKLSGEWEGYYRIRSGKIRIVCAFDFNAKLVFVEEVDFRGNSYK